MNKKQLSIISYIYLILPIIIFALGWLKPIISIPASIALVIILIIKCVKDKDADDEIFINKKRLLLILVFVFLICITAGQGNLFYQSDDWHWRNAIFRDLINMEWPVHYDNTNATLTYYTGFWLLPAVIGKICLIFGETTSWFIANITTLIWCSIGVSLCILWIIKLLKVDTKKKLLIMLVVFFGFSGLDIIGILLMNEMEIIRSLHIEWWAGYFQFSSIITQLFWVYNQCVAAWLIVLMFIGEKKINNYFLLFLLCLPYAPLPMIGLIPLFAVRGVKYLIEKIKEKNILEFIKEMFSIQNILALITILPIYYLYYCSNSAIGSSGRFRVDTDILTTYGMVYLAIFYFLEVGIYAIFLAKKNMKNELFWTATISLLFIPLFRLGLDRDFAMRASIPSLLIITYYLIEYMLNIDTKSIKNTILIIIFALGCITPIIEYSRAFYTILQTGRINAVADKIVTFTDKEIKEYKNFMSPNEGLFKYISK